MNEGLLRWPGGDGALWLTDPLAEAARIECGFRQSCMDRCEYVVTCGHPGTAVVRDGPVRCQGGVYRAQFVAGKKAPVRPQGIGKCTARCGRDVPRCRVDRLVLTKEAAIFAGVDQLIGVATSCDVDDRW